MLFRSVCAVQPSALVPTTVYVVDAAGFAVTLAPVDALRPVEGFQVYVVAPVAVSVPLVPAQIVIGETFTVGGGETFTTAVPDAVQPQVFVTVSV